MTEVNSTGSVWRGRLVIIGVLLVILFAVVGPIILIKSGWRPAKTANHGTLYSPARAIEDVRLFTLQGKPIRFYDIKGKWTYIYFGSAECPSNSMVQKSACERSLYKMRQVRQTQGRYLKRIRNIYIVTDTKALDLLRFTLKDYPDILALTGSKKDIQRLAAQFELNGTSPLDGSHRIYLIDPLGNLFMMYAGDSSPSGMRKDIERLLKHSKIG